MASMPHILKRALTTSLIAAGLAAAAAGCGGDDGSDAADLTEFAPPDSVLFVEGAVRPEGDLKDSIDSILGRFPEGDQLGAKLIEEINQSAREDGEDLSYEQDVEPWLGERAAFYASGFEVTASGGGESSTEPTAGAVIVETTDDGQAEESIRKLAETEGSLTEREYEGVSYEVSEDPSSDDPAAFVVLDGVAVVGNEQGLKDTVDASNGENLSSQSDYAEFRDDAGSGLYGSLFVDGKAILDSIPTGPGFSAEQRRSFEQAYGEVLEQPIMGALEVSEDEAALEFSQGVTELATAGESALLESGFAESWAALALPGFGKAAGGSFEQAAGFGLSESELNQANAQLQRQLGFELSDIAELGDIAFFAAGESIVELQVGGIVEIPDADARERLLAALRRGVERSGQAQVRPLDLSGADQAFSIQTPALPVPINVASAGERVVIGAGPATQTLLSGEGGFTDSQGFDDASDALGEGISLGFLLEFAPIVELVESTGQADADFEQARPYLEAFDLIALGSERSGERDITRLVFTFSD